MLQCPSNIRPVTISNISQPAWPIKAKFCVEPPWVGGTKVCCHIHMTKMATTLIYGKNPSKIFSRTTFFLFLLADDVKSPDARQGYYKLFSCSTVLSMKLKLLINTEIAKLKINDLNHQRLLFILLITF